MLKSNNLLIMCALSDVMNRAPQAAAPQNGESGFRVESNKYKIAQMQSKTQKQFKLTLLSQQFLFSHLASVLPQQA